MYIEVTLIIVFYHNANDRFCNVTIDIRKYSITGFSRIIMKSVTYSGLVKQETRILYTFYHDFIQNARSTEHRESGKF